MVKTIITLLLCVLLPTQIVVAKENIKAVVNLSLSKATVWQREPIMVTLTVTSKDTLSRLASDAFVQDGLDIVTYEQVFVEEEKQLKLILQWQVFPFIAGEKQLKLPEIRYRPNSGRARILDLPKQTIQVKALPIYIPPTMPVGKVALEGEWEGGNIIPSKKLMTWGISVNSKDVSKQTLPAVSRLLVSNPSLQMLPLKRSLKTSKKGGGVLYRQHYQIPFKATSQGVLKLPKIAVSFFNPESGRIEKATLNVPTVLVLNTWLLILFGLALLAAFIFISLKLLPVIKKMLKQRALRKKALAQLKAATNYPHARSALSQFSQSKDWHSNTSLDQFARQCQAQSGTDIHDLIDQLQRYRFSSKHNENLQPLTKQLYKKLRAC